MNLKDAEGFTPMHWAADEGRFIYYIRAYYPAPVTNL